MRKSIFFCVLLCAFMVASHLANSKALADNTSIWIGETVDMDYLNRPHFRFHGDIEEAKTLYMQAWNYLQNMKQSVAPGLGVQGPFRRVFDDGTEFLVRCVAGVDMIEIFVPEPPPAVIPEQEERKEYLLFYRFQIRRMDNSIVEHDKLPGAKIVTYNINGFKFEGIENDSAWMQIYFHKLVDGEDWFNWDWTIIDTWEYTPLLLLDESDIPDWCNRMVEGGFVHSWRKNPQGEVDSLLPEGDFRLLAYNKYDKQLYFFFSDLDEYITERGLHKKSMLGFHFWEDDFSVGGSLSFAPTVETEFENPDKMLDGRKAKKNERYYHVESTDDDRLCYGERGFPGLDNSEVAIKPSIPYWIPPEEYIVYIPWEIKNHDYESEGMNDIASMQGKAQLSRFFEYCNHYENVLLIYQVNRGTDFAGDKDIIVEPGNCMDPYSFEIETIRDFYLTITIEDESVFTESSYMGLWGSEFEEEYDEEGLRQEIVQPGENQTYYMGVDVEPWSGSSCGYLYSYVQRGYDDWCWCLASDCVPEGYYDGDKGALGNFSMTVGRINGAKIVLQDSEEE